MTVLDFMHSSDTVLLVLRTWVQENCSIPCLLLKEFNQYTVACSWQNFPAAHRVTDVEYPLDKRQPRLSDHSLYSLGLQYHQALGRAQAVATKDKKAPICTISFVMKNIVRHVKFQHFIQITDQRKNTGHSKINEQTAESLEIAQSNKRQENLRYQLNHLTFGVFD